MINEIVLGAAAEAIFGYLLEQSGLVEEVQRRLGRHPVQMAIKTALAHAIYQLQQQHSKEELQKLLFDDHFLKKHAPPLLARVLLRDGTVTPQDLAKLWAEHVGGDDKWQEQRAQAVLAPSTVFIEAYTEALRKEPLFQGLWDSKALDGLNSTSERIVTLLEYVDKEVVRIPGLLERLDQRLTELLAALQGNPSVNLGGSGAVAVGEGSRAVYIHTIQVLTAGLDALPVDYSGRVQNFLHEYLGSATTRVPFGGRGEALATLDAWLADPSAPPYALIAAEAGRGKSALLARWAARLQARGEVSVVFLPVSIRFETALASVAFAALAARLGEVYGEPVKAAELSAETWRGLCEGFLRRSPPDGKRVVVVLDGLDEAAGWALGAGFFPREVPEGLRVVVSARLLAGETGAEGWRRRLGWESEVLAREVALRPLTASGVGEVLAAMGNPLDELATRVDVVGQLHRLSEGDPLLVRLYVEALVARGAAAAYLRPEELEAIPPGLAGYFDRWWQEQRALWGDKAPLKERAVETVLNLLASALGPLEEATLLDLAPAKSGLSTWTLEEALLPLRRFIVGRQGSGYAFSHPRLGYYFWERLRPQERAAWEARYLALGEAVLGTLHDGTLAPKDAPPYIVQHYGAHLARAEAPDAALHALVSEGWMRAWEWTEGTHAGFLTDVGRSWARADAQGPGQGAAIAQQVRCALCEASVVALNNSISTELLALCVGYGVLSARQALVIASLGSDSQRQRSQLIRLAPLLPHELHGEALLIAHKIIDEEDRSHVFVSLTPYLSEQQRDEVLQGARLITDEKARARVLAKVATCPSDNQQEEALQEALAAVQDVKDTQYRALMLGRLAPCLSEQQRGRVLREAIAAAREIEDAGERSHALAILSPCLSRDQREEVLQEALAAALQIEDVRHRARVLVRLVPHLNDDQREEVLQEALKATREIRMQRWYPRVLGELVPYLSGDQREEVLQEALAAALQIVNVRYGARILIDLAPYVDDAYREKMLRDVRDIEDEGGRAIQLGRLAPHLSGNQREEALQEALAAAQGILNKRGQAKVLVFLAPQLNQGQRKEVLQEALAAVREINDDWGRACLLVAIASHLREEQREEVLALAQGIVDEWERVRLLIPLFPYLREGQRGEVLATAQAIRDDSERVRLLEALVPYLREDQREKALAMAQEIMGEWERAQLFRSLTPHLSENQKEEMLRVVQEITDEGIRFWLLAQVALHLSKEQRQEILTAAQKITNNELHNSVLMELASNLSEDQKRTGLRKILTAPSVLDYLAEGLTVAAEEVVQRSLEAIVGITDDEERPEKLESIAPNLATWAAHTPIAAWHLWSTTLYTLARYPRPAFLRDLAALMPFALALAGDEADIAAQGIFETISDVSTWWP